MAVYVKLIVDLMSKGRVMDCWASPQRECSNSSPDVGYETVVLQSNLNMADAEMLVASVAAQMRVRQVLLKRVAGKCELE